jgi:glutathione S-transferase
VLIESHLMLDYLDSLVPADRRVFPATEPARHQALKVSALATGLGDKAISLFYELRLHEKVSNLWIGRCRTQIEAVLAVLEADRQEGPTPYWFDGRIGHADIAVAAALRFIDEAIPGWFR